MYLNYNKVLLSIGLLFIGIIVLFLPAIMTLSVFVFMTTAIGLYHAIQRYDIDYKYWFSFIGQLLALILIIGSFVTVFSLLVNLIKP